jgi:hypothetical protein
VSKYDSFFVSEQVHERKVTLADGSEHVLYFKEVPATVYRKFLHAEQSEDEDVRASSLAKLISASMCEEDGSPAMTFEQAKQLKAGVSGALMDAVLEVNGRKPGNVLPPAGENSGSGTSSPSPSAEEQ